jgi:hypothetical protein
VVLHEAREVMFAAGGEPHLMQSEEIDPGLFFELAPQATDRLAELLFLG